MTLRQRLLKLVYPLLMLVRKRVGNRNVVLSDKGTTPPVSFYSLKGKLNAGQELDFNSLKGKKVLLVNTASNCGYTNQYDQLEKLSEQYKDRLAVIAFPANDFKEQEKGDNAEIAAFCRINYGVTFPLMEKSSVLKKSGQNPVFSWLSDPAQNGWNDKQPSWNFSKYLVSETGRLTHYFDPAINPLSKEVIAAIEK